jgi:glutaredoxin
MKVKKKTKKPSKTTKKPVKPVKQVKQRIKAAKTIKDDGALKSKLMVCVVTGRERRVSKAGMAKGIKKFGGLGGFIEHYVCNEAKRLLRQRISPEEVQKQLRPSNLKPFSIDKQVLARLKLLKKPRHKKMTMEEVQQISIKWVPKEPRKYTDREEYVVENTKNGSCLAPQIFLNSDRVCDHCEYNAWCLAPIKTFSKKYKR